ncbi:MAG: amino acid racemase [candidate division NC10 bacterium]|nr:amino acid racemase [candidate division NC10 bacterium]
MGEKNVSPKVIGILGGMGPEATADLFYKIIKATPAKEDQDHPKVLIYSNPQIPDRTTAILGGGKDLLPPLIESAKLLQRAGANFLVIPCITVHHFYRELRAAVNLPILHIIWETAAYVREKYPNLKRIGLLATTGTLRTRLFEREFEPIGIDLLIPLPELQEALVMEAIYGKGGIKGGVTGGRPRELILEASRHLMGQGAEAVVAGCTEVPLVIKDGDLPVPVIDPTWILAQVAVKKAFNLGDY